MLTLAYPPTVNHYWKAYAATDGVRFHICDAGKTFRKLVGQQVMLARTQARAAGITFPIKGPLFVCAFVFPPDRRPRDLDNILKPLCDSLEHAGVIENDKDIDVLLVKRCSRHPGGRVDVSITQTI